ncbi:MAG: SdpI family protein [Oscillospiraceae bacterium]|nr:SdpI family protein [Oscillospiraceae bacterium]
MSGLFGFVSGSVIVPVVFVIFGLILWKAAPPINDFFGYRSKRSRQSALAWGFAQKTAGRLMVIIGAPMIIVSLAAGLFAEKRLDTDGKFWALMIIIALQTAVMGYVNYRVECKLKATFDENGQPRE